MTKIFIVSENEFNPDIYLVTDNIESVKKFKPKKPCFVDVWENEENIDSLSFEKFLERY